MRGYLRFKLAKVEGNFERFIELAQLLSNLRQPEPAMRAHQLRRCVFFKGIGRLLVLPRIDQNQRQAVPGAVELRVNCQRLAKRTTSISLLPELLQGIAKIEPLKGTCRRVCVSRRRLSTALSKLPCVALMCAWLASVWQSIGRSSSSRSKQAPAAVLRPKASKSTARIRKCRKVTHNQAIFIGTAPNQC